MIKDIEISIEFIDELWKEQKAMQETINVDHPEFINKSPDEYRCWGLHERKMMKLDRIKRRLEGL